MKVEAGNSGIHGKGLFATDRISKGELVGKFKGMPTQSDGIHVLWFEDNSGWQGLEVNNVLKYANHSSNPNVEVLGSGDVCYSPHF